MIDRYSQRPGSQPDRVRRLVWIARLGQITRLVQLRGTVERLPDESRQIATSTGWLALEYAARMVMGLLVGAYVARHLGPAPFGLLNYAISFVFLFSALARLGLDNMLVRDLVAHSEREIETLSAAFALQLTGGTLAVVLIGAVAWISQIDQTTRLAIMIISLGLLFQPFEVSAYWFFARTFARPVAIARLVALALISGIRVTFVLFDKPVLWFAWPLMLDTAMAGICVFLFYVRFNTTAVMHWRPRLGRVAAMLKDAWPLALSVLLTEFQLRIDQVILGGTRGSIDVGWYAAAARLSQMAYVLPTLLATATYAEIVRARETSRHLYGQRMQTFYNLMLWLGIGIAFPTALFAGPMVRLLYGEAYLPTASILHVHAWSLVFVCLGMARGRWLIAEGLHSRVLITSVTAAASNFMFNLALIPNYGGLGAAWACLLAQFFSLVLLDCVDARTRPSISMMLAALLTPFRRYAAKNN